MATVPQNNDPSVAKGLIIKYFCNIKKTYLCDKKIPFLSHTGMVMMHTCIQLYQKNTLLKKIFFYSQFNPFEYGFCFSFCPGMMMHECNQLYQEGLRGYVTDWWNWIDLALIFLYLSFYSLQIAVFIKVNNITIEFTLL